MAVRRPRIARAPLGAVGLALVGSLCSAGSLAAQTGEAVTVDRLRTVPDTEWLNYGRDHAETHYSPLSQVSRETIGGLDLVWSWEIPRTGARLEATPIVSNGVMYATGPRSYVYALDARTGALKWEWDPMITASADGGPSACCGDVNRGVAILEDHVFVGLLDGRLVALDRETGALVWAVETSPPGSDYTITGAPRIADGKVVIGNGGAEYGVRGYVTAYDPRTGDQVWRFHTVPGNPADGFESEAMRAAAETWNGEWWRVGGGGTAWDAFAYDPEAGLLYIGTGNGSPWNRDTRSPGGGDNLYLSSIVAVDAATGEYAWHYQTSPGDDWDYTATQPLMLLDIEIQGVERKVIVQAPKNGFFYVLDRLTGEFISAEAFADDLTWATGVDPETGRPIEAPEARYGMTGRGVYLSPGPTGAHLWWPMSFDPASGLVFIPAQNTAFYYSRTEGFDYQPGRWNTGVSLGFARGRPPRPESQGPPTMLLGWDPVLNREVWRAVTPGGHGGTLATAGGLVFHGVGDLMIARDSSTGEELWAAEVGRGTATPVTYAIDGRQYVSIAGGGSGGVPPTVWTFALPAGF